VIFTDSGTADDMPLPGLLHVNFFDQEENAVSANITIDHELNFINVAKIYPGGLQGIDPLGAGWVDVRTPDLLGNGWMTEDGTPKECGQMRLWQGYSLQRAIDTTTSLDVIFEAHRDADSSSVLPPDPTPIP
jgi:hypothetical protein